MSLFDTIGGWIDTGVDWVAEAIGYTDIVESAGMYSDFADTYTAGEQLASDVKSFMDSDTFGFIKEGAKAYTQTAGLYNAKGERTQQQYFTPPTSARGRARPVGQLTSGSAAMVRSPVTATRVNVGYNNPDVQTALTSLINNSYNQQMNNMFASYIVTPTIQSGKRTVGIGSTTVKGVGQSTKTTSRKSRGLA